MLASGWQQIQDSSQKIQNHVSEKKWEEVIAIAKQRHEKILKHFEDFPINSNNTNFYMDAITNIVESEKTLLEMIEAEKLKINTEISLIHNQHQAAKAYELIQS